MGEKTSTNTDPQRLAEALRAARVRRARVRRTRRTRIDTQSNHHAAEIAGRS